MNSYKLCNTNLLCPSSIQQIVINVSTQLATVSHESMVTFIPPLLLLLLLILNFCIIIKSYNRGSINTNLQYYTYYKMAAIKIVDKPAEDARTQ